MGTNDTPKIPTTPSQPVTVDTDVRTHMLGTYASLRLLMAVATAAFLLTLSGYRAFGHDLDAAGQPIHRYSISAYYHHPNAPFRMKDVFVGAFVAVGLLIICYQGYTDRENWALNIAGAGLLCVVSFPMDWDPANNRASEHMTWRGYLHYAGALAFFLPIGYVALYRAHDTLGLLPKGPRKRLFKNLYRITGAFMWAVPVVAVVLYLAGNKEVVYVVEYFGVTVFLAYWMVKSYEMKVSPMETREGLGVAEACAVGPKRGGEPGRSPPRR